MSDISFYVGVPFQFQGNNVSLFVLVRMEDTLVCLAESRTEGGAEMTKFNLAKEEQL